MTLWKIFNEISAIPRASGNEALICKYLIEKAVSRNWKWHQDARGNVMLRKEAAAGFEAVEPIILQGHVDMVCEKEGGSRHNFDVDPLHLQIDEVDGVRWLSAKETSLGADNGVALAMGLALLEEEMKSGPIELLFTVDEEVGLTGALELEPSFLRGKKLINLDSEDEGEFCVGCAGGETLLFKKEFVEEENCLPFIYQFDVRELLGGHSGVEIHKNRNNAIILLLKTLQTQLTDIPYQILRIQAEFKHNVIPTSCTLLVAAQKELFPDVFSTIPFTNEEIKKGASFSCTKIEKNDTCDEKALSASESKKLLNRMIKIPTGALEWQNEIVETSANLATLLYKKGKLEAVLSIRSLKEEKQEALRKKIVDLLTNAHFTVESDGGYPCWTPEWDSPFLAEACKSWELFFDKKPHVNVIHAGLECGVIGKKIEGCKMISLGPDIVDVHSPSEKLNMDSMERVYSFVKFFISSMSASVCS